MLIFRSEERVNRWLSRRNLQKGAIFSVEQCWRLRRIWYRDRVDEDWRRRTAEEAEAAFASVGLTGEFWRLS